MKKYFGIWYFICCVSFCPALLAQPTNGFKFIDANSLSVLGRSKEINSQLFHRVDSSYFPVLPKRVAELARNSSGISICFQTNSRSIRLKWTLAAFNQLWNMTPLSVNGLDLYGWNEQWQYVASARPVGDSNQVVLIDGMDGTSRHYRLFLPLYAELKTLEIGIDSGSQIIPAQSNYLPAKKVVFYGSSITQGASASRPGMAYPSILSRRLFIDAFNLGFSGSGRMELEMADILGNMDAEIYVLDCVPNPPPEEIRQRALPFIKRLRELKPHTPILMVESITRETTHWNAASRKRVNSQNHEFLRAWEQLRKEGYASIHYLSTETLIGSDHEATIDGTHLTDVGFLRIADAISAELERILNE